MGGARRAPRRTRRAHHKFEAPRASCVGQLDLPRREDAHTRSVVCPACHQLMPSMRPCGVRSAMSCACSATRQRRRMTPLLAPFSMCSMRATHQTLGSSLWWTLRRGSRRASHVSRVAFVSDEGAGVLAHVASPVCQRSPSAASESFLVTIP